MWPTDLSPRDLRQCATGSERDARACKRGHHTRYLQPRAARYAAGCRSGDSEPTGKL